MKSISVRAKVCFLKNMVFIISSSAFLITGMTSLWILPIVLIYIIGMSIFARKVSMPGITFANSRSLEDDKKYSLFSAEVLLAIVIVFVRSKYFFTSLRTNEMYLRLISALHIHPTITVFLIDLILSVASVYAVLSVLQTLFSGVKKQQGPALNSFSNLSRAKLYVILIVLSLCYTFVFSANSPIHYAVPGGDYSIFYLVGKAWSQGYVPYVDVFDHKGPLIFFIYMLGQIVSTDFGIYLLQTIALFVSLLFAFKISAENENGIDYFWGSISVCGVLLYVYRVEYGGALTEEFCLPFLMASVYFANRYFKSLNGGG